MKMLKIAVLLLLCVSMCRAMLPDEIEDFKNFLEETSKLDQILTRKGSTPDDSDHDETIADDAWEQSGKFEGDLILNDRQRRLIVQDVVEGLSRNGLQDITKRWPDNELIYYIQKEHFSGDQVQAIIDGLEDLAQASCLKFRPYRKGDRDAVVIQGSRKGCFSNVGYQGGYQILNLNARHPAGRGCFRHGTIVHELLHSLGFYHMQSSPDRDDYIDVKWENILQNTRHNFRKYNTFSVSDFGVGYDYDSVLHYGRRAFSKNGGDTLVPKKSGASIGQRIRLSDKDVQKLNKMYCDSNSNNNDDANKPAIKPDKKKPKNKPFQGHGIGYHQGKAIAIKLPAAETFKLTNTPQLPLFNYFSKATEAAVPTKEIEQTFREGIGTGQEITNPVTYYGNGYSNLANPFGDYRNENDNDHPFKYIFDPKKSIATSKAQESDLTLKKLHKQAIGLVHSKDTNKNKPSSENPLDKSDETKDGLEGKLKDDLDNAFDRLGKIIKTHVYPSQTPDIEVYKPNLGYSKYYNPETKYEPEPEIVKVDEAFKSTKVTETDKKAGETIADITANEKKYQTAPKKATEELETETYTDEEYNPAKAYANDHLPRGFDSSYGTSLKRMPTVKYEPFVTPKYANYNYLAHKNDYSKLYNPNASKKSKNRLFGYIVPLNAKIFSSDDFKKDNDKYDQHTYTYSPNSKYESISSKLIEYDDDSDKKSIFGRFRNGTPYSLFGVLVPVTKDWFRVDYDPHSDSYSVDKPESNEDYR